MFVERLQGMRRAVEVVTTETISFFVVRTIHGPSPGAPVQQVFNRISKVSLNPHDRWASYASDKRSQKDNTQIGKWLESVLPTSKTAAWLRDWGLDASFREFDKGCFTVSQRGTGWFSRSVGFNDVRMLQVRPNWDADPVARSRSWVRKLILEKFRSHETPLWENQFGIKC